MDEMAQLPVTQATLERLEARRQKWGHDDFAATVALMLDMIDTAEAIEAQAQADGSGQQT